MREELIFWSQNIECRCITFYKKQQNPVNFGLEIIIDLKT